MVGNKLCWDARHTVGRSKQRKVGLDWDEFLCFGSPTLIDSNVMDWANVTKIHTLPSAKRYFATD